MYYEQYLERILQLTCEGVSQRAYILVKLFDECHMGRGFEVAGNVYTSDQAILHV